MNRIVAGAACLNQVPLDWEGNRRRAIAAIEEARESGIGFLCLPELALTGYGCEDMFLSPEVGERSMRSLSRLAKDRGAKTTRNRLLRYPGAFFDSQTLQTAV